jgi:threonine synthase
MKFYNLKHPEQVVTFKQAVMLGLGQDRGLFFPMNWPEWEADFIDSLLDMPFAERCVALYSALLKDEFDEGTIKHIVETAFNFPIAFKTLNQSKGLPDTGPDQQSSQQPEQQMPAQAVSVLELFHGPTLAFKDFGCRFFAACVNAIRQQQAQRKTTQKPDTTAQQKLTIVSATSGDTGAAVAHAFYRQPNVDVHILYPKGKISPLQEQLFCTLGHNITTYAVQSSFDHCQELVKQAFTDLDIASHLELNSANSINVSRLLAQVAYYFEAVAQARLTDNKDIVVAVPSGNFGNLTAGLMAKALGLPIKRFVIATNANDTVPRYLASHHWTPKPTVETIANAMDISDPSNWPRVEELLNYKNWQLDELKAVSFDDAAAAKAVVNLAKQNYLSEPHSAIAYQAIVEALDTDEQGVFIATADPSKFDQVVESILERPVTIPERLQKYSKKQLLSKEIKADFSVLKACLLKTD